MRTVCLFMLAFVAIAFTAQPATAVLQFYNVFRDEYVNNHPDAEFAALVKKSANRCFVCHKGKKRTHRNEFGAHMDDLLNWKEDAKNKEKILAALQKVLAMPADPDNPNGETYLDRWNASQFPAGELEELKQEPEGEAAE